MDSLTSVNHHKCSEIAERISGTEIRDTFYSRPFLTVKGNVESKIRGYFYSVAICHQTYNLRNPDLNLYGWDYIEYVFTKMIAQNSAFLQPGNLLSSGIQGIIGQLSNFFQDQSLQNYSSLDRLNERATMLFELDSFIDEFYEASIELLLEQTDGYLSNYGNGYYEILPKVPAFSDPYKKKITFLVKLLQDSGLSKVKDPYNVIPIMDYHMQRVLLRMGCIELENQYLREQLIQHSRIESDEAIRKACIEAFLIIADLSGVDIMKLNDFFWSLGRSCCNENPICTSGRCDKVPCTFYSIVNITEHSSCYFSSECKGSTNKKYRELWQPNVETHYY